MAYGAGMGEQATRVVNAVRPDVVILDLQLPDLPGVEVTHGVLSALPTARVLTLSAGAEQQDVLDAVTAGAAGYLVKSASRAELLDAVRRTASGDAVFTPGLAGLVLAGRLSLSHRTVQNHVQNALSKLQLHNRVELTRYAIEHGLDKDSG